MNPLPRSATLCLALSALLVIGIGCQARPPIGKVKGKVTVGGKAVNGGTVVMENEEAGIALSAPINEDGTYQMRTFEADGLPPGHYKVAVSPQRIAVSDAVVLATDRPQAPPPSVEIPARYHSVSSSGLRAEVKAGNNPPYDFDLK